MGNDVEVFYVSTINLLLETGFELCLENCFYVPYFKRNLIYVSLLDKYGYIPMFGNGKVDLWFNSQSIGSCFLFYYLCRLCLAPSSVDYSLNVERFLLKDL